MARVKSKSVYERIEEKEQNIRETQELFAEKDDLEMRQLLSQMKANNLDINKALDLLNKTK